MNEMSMRRPNISEHVAKKICCERLLFHNHDNVKDVHKQSDTVTVLFTPEWFSRTVTISWYCNIHACYHFIKGNKKEYFQHLQFQVF